jgi:SAP domain
MGREIDIDNLTLDDALHLEQRPWKIAEIEQVHGVDDIRDRIGEVKEAEAAKLNEAAESGKYDSLNIRDLRTLAASRLLDKSGNKSDLISRLQDEDDRLAATRRRASPVSINENEGDSVLGDSHPEPDAQ